MQTTHFHCFVKPHFYLPFFFVKPPPEKKKTHTRGYPGTRFSLFPLWTRWGIGSKTKHSCDSVSEVCDSSVWEGGETHPSVFLHTLKGHFRSPASRITFNSQFPPRFVPAAHFTPASPSALDTLALNFHPHRLNLPNTHRAEPQPQKWDRPLGNSDPLSQHTLPFTSASAWESHWDAAVMQLSIYNMWAGHWSKKTSVKARWNVGSWIYIIAFPFLHRASEDHFLFYRIFPPKNVSFGPVEL